MKKWWTRSASHFKISLGLLKCSLLAIAINRWKMVSSNSTKFEVFPEIVCHQNAWVVFGTPRVAAVCIFYQRIPSGYTLFYNLRQISDALPYNSMFIYCMESLAPAAWCLTITVELILVYTYCFAPTALMLWSTPVWHLCLWICFCVFLCFVFFGLSVLSPHGSEIIRALFLSV